MTDRSPPMTQNPLDAKGLAAATAAVTAEIDRYWKDDSVPAGHEPVAAAAIRAYLASLAAAAPSEEPVAWLRPKDIARLAEMHSGAINVQIANLSFVGCTVPVFAPPAVAPVANDSAIDGWRPIVQRPTDHSEGWFKLADGSTFWGRWNRDHWERRTDALTMMAPIEARGGVEREDVEYPLNIFERLPNGIYPIAFRSAPVAPVAVSVKAEALDQVCHDMFHALIGVRDTWKTISPGAAAKLDAMDAAAAAIRSLSTASAGKETP